MKEINIELDNQGWLECPLCTEDYCQCRILNKNCLIVGKIDKIDDISDNCPAKKGIIIKILPEK